MTIEDLKNYGADTAEGLQRCVNNESFYLRMVKMIPGDSNFSKLYEAIEAADYEAAFEAAHALKGVAGNLALTPVFGPVSEITELLRGRTETDYTALIETIRKKQEELMLLCREEGSVN